MRRRAAVILVILVSTTLFAEVKSGITGLVEWDTLKIKAAVYMELSSAGIKLPNGRNHGEALINLEFERLIRPGIFGIQVDSSSTIADLVNRGELSLLEAQNLALMAESIPASLSPDLKNIYASYTLGISSVSSALLRHERPSQIIRTLIPVPAPVYTGIIIIASEKLPVHGTKSSAFPIPCLFPKIWDTDMNLIFERNMFALKNSAMVRYSPAESIFRNNPSGLSRELTDLAGERPLRIFARGVFGIKPTDLIIDREDALLIISRPENRQLLTEGKVAIILDDSVLRSEFSGE
ncbi:MAG: polymerase [Treponema sp.]|jgi:hypothetical protein|nr:polymerase [Treponema sp.]